MGAIPTDPVYMKLSQSNEPSLIETDPFEIVQNNWNWPTQTDPIYMKLIHHSIRVETRTVLTDLFEPGRFSPVS